MASFPELNIFARIIKLPELKVKDYQFIEGFGIVITVEKIEKKSCCPRCGKKSAQLDIIPLDGTGRLRLIAYTLHHEYLVRDLPTSEHQVYLKINRRQLKCTDCKKPFTKINPLITRFSHPKGDRAFVGWAMLVFEYSRELKLRLPTLLTEYTSDRII